VSQTGGASIGSGRPHGRLSRWWVAAVAALAAVVVVVVVLAGRSGSGPSALGTPTPSPGAPSSSADCQVRVTESGFSNRYGLVYGLQVPPTKGEIQYGIILINPCPQAATNVQLLVQGVDGTGRLVPYDDGVGGAAEPRTVPVLAPGQRVGVAGELANARAAGTAAGGYDPTRVAAIAVIVRHTDWQTASALADQVAATATDVVVGPRGGDGYAPVRFTLRLNPPRLTGAAWGCIIVRNATGTVVSGDVQRLSLPVALNPTGDIIQTEAWVPAAATDLRAEVYYVPGGF
jgi:hypothetical protein